MDLIKEALSMGFRRCSDHGYKRSGICAGIQTVLRGHSVEITTWFLHVHLPAGTVEEMQAKALKYEKGTGSPDCSEGSDHGSGTFSKQAKHAQNISQNSLPDRCRKREKKIS